jgi:hypothetical protein
MARSYDILIEKLDSFIRKFYKNQVFRGLIYSVGLVGGFFLLIALLEYFGNFGTTVRTILFWSFAVTSVYVIARFIVTPLIKLWHLGKVISYEVASRIIGKHFTEVQDKLLNTLQLNELEHESSPDSLIQASIDQKAAELSPIPFNNAIDLGANRKYLKYALPPLALLIIILFAAPSIIKDSTKRIVSYNKEFVAEAPFSFNVENPSLKVPAQDDLLLKVRLTGDAFPQQVKINLGNSSFRMTKESPVEFTYQLKSLQENQTFLLEADGFKSIPYTIEVLPRPVLLGFQVTLDYPAYTGLKDEVLRNTGDLTVPVGTKAKWSFDTENTEALMLGFRDSTYSPEAESKGLYFFSDRLTRSERYTVVTQNRHMVSPDSISYSINVIPDLYPEIDITEQRDSTNDRNIYFQGEIRDDHGFSQLYFRYSLITDRAADSTTVKGPQQEAIPVSSNNTAERFFHAVSLDRLNIKAGDQVEYYFEVWDNDGYAGAKSTRSKAMKYEAPSEDQLAELEEKNNQEIKDKLEKSIKDAKDLQKEVEALRRDVMEKKELDWQDKKKIEKLLEQQKNLEQQMQQVQQQNKEQLQMQEQFKTMDENLLEKQQKLQELFEKVMSPEMQEMMAEMQRLMEEMDPEKLQEQLEKMELTNEDIEAELDRNLELFKQMEFEQKAEEIKEKLDELAEKQNDLAEDTEKGEKTDEELKAEQDKLNEEFEKVKEEMDKLEELNEELEEKNNMDMMGLEEEVSEEMEESSDSLEEGEKQDASESQKSASEKMQQMSQMMSAMAGAAGAEQQQEDMDALRALLENIIELSFDQEEVMQSIKSLETDDPKYKDHGQTQRKLKDDAVVIKDSLLALSKRVIQIQSIVNKEINAVNANMDGAIDLLADRQTGPATVKQQYVMTSLNNLALLLDEALQQMQQQMANSMPGSGNCEKPGGTGKGKPKPGGKPGSMSKMQEAMQKKLQELQKGMTPGPGKAGASPGRFGMSEQMARTAAEQGAIRRELERMSQELNKDGSGAGNELKEIAKDMEETEKDIVNMRITRQTIERQQEILTRLLKSEKAEREREQDNKRTSNEAQDHPLSSPENFFEYQKAKQKEVELLRTVPPSLKPYYKNKVNEYFLNFDQP